MLIQGVDNLDRWKESIIMYKYILIYLLCFNVSYASVKYAGDVNKKIYIS